MLKGGAIAPLVESLNNGTEEQIEHALCALGNLASHTTENGAAIVNEGAIGSLKAVLRAGTEEHKGLAAFTLGYLGLVNETIRLTVRDEDTMDRMVQLLLVTTGEQKNQAMSAICFLTHHGDGDLDYIKSESIIPELIEYLRGKEAQHQYFAATVLGRFADGDDAYTALIANNGAIPPLVIKHLGAIALLKKLCRMGSRQLKRSAATALAYLENEVSIKRSRREEA